MFFGGSTIPFYFLSKQTKKLNLFATTSYINSPVDFLNPIGGRQDDWMQTGGFGYQPSEKWSIQGTGGVSTHGGMGRGEINYVSPRFSFFAGGGSSSLLFPLNRVQSLFSGTTAAKAGFKVTKIERENLI